MKVCKGLQGEYKTAREVITISKLKIIPCSLKQASEFVNSNHRHHKASIGCKFSIAVADDKEVHGVAICGRPVSRYLDDGFTLEILRCCTDGTQNACSMLYGACCRIAKQMGYSDIITYTLLSENGASLKASNFECEGEAGGTHWTGIRDKGQRLPNELKTRWHKHLKDIEKCNYFHIADEITDNQLSLFEE